MYRLPCRRASEQAAGEVEQAQGLASPGEVLQRAARLVTPGGPLVSNEAAIHERKQREKQNVTAAQAARDAEVAAQARALAILVPIISKLQKNRYQEISIMEETRIKGNL